KPKLIAGFKWQPEMCPMANAMVSTVKPKARATPTNPMPSVGKPAASTAAPHPPKTSQKVPKNSARARLLRVIRSPHRETKVSFRLPGLGLSRRGRLAQTGAVVSMSLLFVFLASEVQWRSGTLRRLFLQADQDCPFSGAMLGC